MVEASTPMKSPEPSGAPSLADLGKKIKSEHEALASMLGGILPRAIGIGKDLNNAKRIIAHGGFLKWVSLHCAMTNKTAERYMKLATNEDKLLVKLRELKGDKFEIVSNLSLASAERLITESAGGGGSGNGDDVSAAYDRAQKTLIEKLEALSVDVADAAVAETIERLKLIVEAKKKTLKAAAA